jgi:hypothetical protein
MNKKHDPWSHDNRKAPPGMTKPFALLARLD